MAFITKSNFHRILGIINLEKFDNYAPIYKNARLEMFSRNEKAKLRAFAHMLEHPNKAVLYRKTERQDQYEYLNWSGDSALTYHLDKDCERLHASFKGDLIPKELKDKGKDQVQRFRKWYFANRHLKEANPAEFNRLMKDVFGEVYSIVTVEYENTGIHHMLELTPKEIEEELDKLLLEEQSFVNQDEKHHVIFTNYYKRTYLGTRTAPLDDNRTGYLDDEVKAVLKEYEFKYKRPIYYYLREYFRVTLNPDMRMDESILVQLGFKPCSKCCKQVYRDLLRTVQDSPDLVSLNQTRDSNSMDRPNATPKMNSFQPKPLLNPKLKSALESASLYEQFKNVEEVAKQRNLAISTVYGHLFMSGTLDPNALISKENFARALDIWTNKQEGEQIRPKLEAFLDVAGIAAFYHILRNK